MDLRVAVIGVWVLLAGCAPAPTPLPITPIATRPPQASPAADTTQTEAEPIRYGLLPNAANHAPLDALRADGIIVEVLAPGDNQADYTILAGYGLYDGWEQPSVSPPPIALRLDPTRAPLDNPAVHDIIIAAVRADDIVATLGIPGVTALQPNDPTPPRTLREQLANLGYPEGITLYGWVTDAPGVGMVIGQLQEANIRFVRTPAAVPGVHMTVGPLTATDADSITPLYTLPISYSAPSTLNRAFTDDGWPIFAR